MSKEKPKTDAPRKTGFLGLIKRMRHDEEGVTAVEFALIAAPFFALIVALLETALVHMTTLDLENAVKDASRQIRTGQAQEASLSPEQFKDLVCDKVVLIQSCKANPNLLLDVRSYDNFDSIEIDPSDLYDEDGNFTGEPSFSMGGGLKVVVIRTYYRMKLLAQIPTIGLANAGPHHRMIDAVTVFRNEPF